MKEPVVINAGLLHLWRKLNRVQGKSSNTGLLYACFERRWWDFGLSVLNFPLKQLDTGLYVWLAFRPATITWKAAPLSDILASTASTDISGAF
jgi:hypothetical protein